MADELLIMLLCLLSLWIARLEINVALYNLYATALHRRRNTVFGALIKRASANSTVLPSKTVLRRTILDSVVLFQCGQRNSLKTINVDGEHFIRFRGKSCVFKFIWLSVDVALFTPNLPASFSTVTRHCSSVRN